MDNKELHLLFLGKYVIKQYDTLYFYFFTLVDVLLVTSH